MNTIFNSKEQYTGTLNAAKRTAIEILYPLNQEFPDCEKPLDYFVADIKRNLRFWAGDEKCVCYKTSSYLYIAVPQQKVPELVDVIAIKMYGWKRHDFTVKAELIKSYGAEFLRSEPIRNKRIHLFPKSHDENNSAE